MSATATRKDWWVGFYDDAVADLFMKRDDPAALAATLDFLTTQLALSPGDLLFDQCCGNGSLSLPLAKRGVRVVGVDLCASYIARANTEAESADVDARFVCNDAFTFRPDQPCDAAINWYSSFGYAERDERNTEMLRRAYESLRPGGWFALDYLNVANVLAAFQPRTERRGESNGRAVTIVRESELDLVRGVLHQTWTCVAGSETRSTRRSAVRLYLPDRITEMLSACGFTDVAFFGGVDGEPLTRDCRRCIAVARRPED